MGRKAEASPTVYQRSKGETLLQAGMLVGGMLGAFIAADLFIRYDQRRGTRVR